MSATRIYVELESHDVGEALELLRRVRAFAAELLAAGIPVEITGSLGLRVTPPEPVDDEELDEP